MDKWKNTMVWCLLLTKRYLKNPMFLLTILAIPLLALALKNVSGTDESVMQVGIYVENAKDNTLAKQVVERLCGKDTNMVTFYQTDTQASLERMVQRGDVVCGYVFPADFAQHLADYIEGKTAGLPYKRAVIQCIASSDDKFVKLANEMVFSTVYEDFSKMTLEQFMKTGSVVADFGAQDMQELLQRRSAYDDLKVNFFAFFYADGTENTAVGNPAESYLTLPVRGILLALILLAAMMGGVLLGKDMEVGVLDAVNIRRRSRLAYLYIFIPTAIASVVALGGLFLSGTAEGVWREIYVMLLYCFMVTGVIRMLHSLLGQINRFVAIIPVFILINLILCPVFINVANTFLAAEYMQWILPVNYGLRGLHSVLARGMMLAVGSVGIIKTPCLHITE